MFIISDEVLDRLLCSHCKKYLSVKPIKVYPNRGIKCGRCSSEDDAGVVSLFDIVATEGLFRCVNRFEGCNNLLSYSDVAEHEEYCKGGFYDCPLCVDIHGSAYDILQHYKANHNNKLLEAAEFLVELENEVYDVYLYKKNDFLFFVNVKFSISEDELTVMIEYIGAKSAAKQIVHSMNVHSLEGPAKKKSKKRVCSAVAEQDPRLFKFNLKMDDFPKKIAICRFTVDTEAVETLLALPERKFSFGLSEFPFGNKKSAPAGSSSPAPSQLVHNSTTVPNSDSSASTSTTNQPIASQNPHSFGVSSFIVNPSSCQRKTATTPNPFRVTRKPLKPSTLLAAPAGGYLFSPVVGTATTTVTTSSTSVPSNNVFATAPRSNADASTDKRMDWKGFL